MAKKLVYGVALNDADYVVKPMLNGKRTVCPFYLAWQGMLKRCYSEECQARQPTYIGCTVAQEWLVFSNFKAWMCLQDWQGKELDKDLLVKGNRTYSPDSCVFVDAVVNLFTNENNSVRGEWPTGVDFHKATGKFRAMCSNPFSGKKEHIGLFTCPNRAYLAWRERKNDLACQLADLQTDQRVASALRNRYV